MFNLFKSKKNSDKNQKDLSKKESVVVDKHDIQEQERIYREGLVRVLDFISPSALAISASNIQIGEVFCRTLFITAYPRILPVGWMGGIIVLDLPMDISIFIHPIETAKIMKSLRKKTTQIQSELDIEAKKGLTRDPMLEMAYRNVEDLRDKLQEGVEKFFKMGVYINVFGESLEKLNKNANLLITNLESQSIYAKKAIFRMKEGLDSCLPLCTDKLMTGIDFNTSPLSTSFPFISADVTSNQGILYGVNKHNNSLILFDRFTMENANMVVFAKSGAGKSYAIKLEILRSLMLGTTIIVIDPENEYRYLAEAVDGSFIKISLNSPHHINPFHLNAEKDADMAELLRSNTANLLGLLKLMLGNITPEESAVLERSVREVYLSRDISEQTSPERLESMTMPVLSDLYEVLRNMQGSEDLAIRLEKYTKGVFSGFLNHPSNISLNNQLVVFNIRDLEEELRPIAMYLILHHIWNEIRVDVKKRMIVVDEAWVMMENEDAAKFLYSIAKRIRKYYGGLTTITQDVSDFMSSRYGKPIVSNSSMQLLMKQSQSSIDIVADTFYLTDREKFILMNSGVGEGIFFAGSKRAAIQVVASYNEDKLVTTDPAQRLEMKQQEESEDLEIR
ncbi:MAG: ATP-binding protein [Patescibacteria group bacterium]|jgi:conjugal transfer ATP-binding protein TraC|nr:ATP-binding protein [Patescibacteria group bacterium]